MEKIEVSLDALQRSLVKWKNVEDDLKNLRKELSQSILTEDIVEEQLELIYNDIRKPCGICAEVRPALNCTGCPHKSLCREVTGVLDFIGGESYSSLVKRIINSLRVVRLAIRCLENEITRKEEEL